MSKLLLCIPNYTDITVGALRFSDLANTRLVDDGEHHYLDIINRVWSLRSKHTKNKQNREAIISTEFAEFIRDLNIPAEDMLICNKTGNTNRISKEFTNFMEVNFTDVRASYVTYLDSVCDDVDTIRTICNNQGHKLTTALESYRRVKAT
jgi:hypothetical protein